MNKHVCPEEVFNLQIFYSGCLICYFIVHKNCSSTRTVILTVYVVTLTHSAMTDHRNAYWSGLDWVWVRFLVWHELISCRSEEATAGWTLKEETGTIMTWRFPLIRFLQPVLFMPEFQATTRPLDIALCWLLRYNIPQSDMFLSSCVLHLRVMRTPAILFKLLCAFIWTETLG